MLYKTGLAKITNKKGRTKEEIEFEKFGKNCTFKPEILNNSNFKNTDVFEVNYSDKEYVNKFNRLKAGRMERKLKSTVNSREPFTSKIDINEIRGIVLEEKKTKSSLEARQEWKKSSKPKSYSNMRDLVNKNKAPETKAKSPSMTSEELDKLNSIKAEKESIEKSSIPLLIIDVNIRPGDKKKIYVFDGDTAEGLAEQFSKDNCLDNDMKIKLKALIENHMSKLLMRIDEENHSIISESSSNHFNNF